HAFDFCPWLASRFLRQLGSTLPSAAISHRSYARCRGATSQALRPRSSSSQSTAAPLSSRATCSVGGGQWARYCTGCCVFSAHLAVGLIGLSSAICKFC